MLVVIAIIAILAAMILTAVPRVKIMAQKTKAKQEMVNIVAGVHSYEQDYSQFPSSRQAKEMASKPDDFTFGTYNVACLNPGGSPNALSAGFSLPTTPASQYAVTTTTPTSQYQTNNAEVVLILMDLEYLGSPQTQTINFQHVKNTNRKKYLNATSVTGTASSGVGTDGVYRDPWGNPYIITLDLDSCGKTRDAFYRSVPVSAVDVTNPQLGGLNGLFYNADPNYKCYQNNSEIMVWSAGPDRTIDSTKPANTGANKDNVVSWK